MHYVQVHAGDFIRGARHLTPVELGIYWNLLLCYYDRDGQIGSSVREVVRMCPMPGADYTEEAVAAILDEFFELEEDGYHHARADEEIKKVLAKSEKARESANRRHGKAAKAPATADANAPANAPANAERTHSEGTCDRSANRKPSSREPLTVHVRTNERESAPSQNREPAPSSTRTGPPEPDALPGKIAGTIFDLGEARRAQ